MWDVFSTADTAKAEKVASVSAFSWGGSTQTDARSGRVFATPSVQPPGVGLGAGVGIVGPVTRLGLGAGLPIGAAAIAGGAAGLTQYEVERRSTEVVPGTQHGIPFGGPGLKEPGGKYLLKEWHIRMDSKDGDFDLQYYLTMNDRGTKRIFMYNQRTKAWKTWPMPRLAVIGKNMPRHQMITRLRRNLKRHTADAVTILKLTSPNKLESTKKKGGVYVRSKKYHYKD